MKHERTERKLLTGNEGANLGGQYRHLKVLELNLGCCGPEIVMHITRTQT